MNQGRDAEAGYGDAGYADAMADLEALEHADPVTVVVDDTHDLRAVAVAADAVKAAEDQQTLAVTMARVHGRSWTEIAFRLGTSRHAARQRYPQLIDVGSEESPRHSRQAASL